jgi:hypothetical protein
VRSLCYIISLNTSTPVLSTTVWPTPKGDPLTKKTRLSSISINLFCKALYLGSRQPRKWSPDLRGSLRKSMVVSVYATTSPCSGPPSLWKSMLCTRRQNKKELEQSPQSQSCHEEKATRGQINFVAMKSHSFSAPLHIPFSVHHPLHTPSNLSSWLQGPKAGLAALPAPRKPGWVTLPQSNSRLDCNIVLIFNCHFPGPYRQSDTTFDTPQRHRQAATAPRKAGVAPRSFDEPDMAW